MQFSNKQKLIFALFGVVVLAAILLLSMGGNDSRPPDNRYVDDPSGEVVSSPEGKTPEVYGEGSNEPLYLGFTKLVERGITQNQLESFKVALKNFAASQKVELDQVSVYINSIERLPQDSETGTKTISFDIQINRDKNYTVRLQYQSITSTKTTLYVGENKVYESDYINGRDYDETQQGDLYLDPEFR